MDHAGQISSLSQTARPSIGIITNIGVSHIENFGSQEGILKAKLEILDGMSPEAPLLLNGDDPLLLDACGKIKNPVVLFGVRNPACNLRAEQVAEESDGTRFTAVSSNGRQELWVPAVGKHNVYNALAAVAVGELLGLSPEQIRQGLAQYQPSGMRQHVTHCGGDHRGGRLLQRQPRFGKGLPFRVKADAQSGKRAAESPCWVTLPNWGLLPRKRIKNVGNTRPKQAWIYFLPWEKTPATAGIPPRKKACGRRILTTNRR